MNVARPRGVEHETARLGAALGGSLWSNDDIFVVEARWFQAAGARAFFERLVRARQLGSHLIFLVRGPRNQGEREQEAVSSMQGARHSMHQAWSEDWVQ